MEKKIDKDGFLLYVINMTLLAKVGSENSDDMKSVLKSLWDPKFEELRDIVKQVGDRLYSREQDVIAEFVYLQKDGRFNTHEFFELGQRGIKLWVEIKIINTVADNFIGIWSWSVIKNNKKWCDKK